jgi:hypothetical protein
MHFKYLMKAQKCSAKILGRRVFGIARLINIRRLAERLVGGALTKSGLNDVDDGLAGVDVGEDLAAAGRVLGTSLEDNDLGLL